MQQVSRLKIENLVRKASLKIFYKCISLSLGQALHKKILFTFIFYPSRKSINLHLFRKKLWEKAIKNQQKANVSWDLMAIQGQGYPTCRKKLSQSPRQSSFVSLGKAPSLSHARDTRVSRHPNLLVKDVFRPIVWLPLLFQCP